MARITFKYVESLAKQHGYCVEKTGRREDPFELFSNEKMPGMTIGGTLSEIYSEIYWALKDAKAI